MKIITDIETPHQSDDPICDYTAGNNGRRLRWITGVLATVLVIALLGTMLPGESALAHDGENAVPSFTGTMLAHDGENAVPSFRVTNSEHRGLLHRFRRQQESKEPKPKPPKNQRSPEPKKPKKRKY
jgi:hypothetical protein